MFIFFHVRALCKVFLRVFERLYHLKKYQFLCEITAMKTHDDGGEMVFARARVSMDTAWGDLFGYHLRHMGPRKLTDVPKMSRKLHTEIHYVEKALDSPFEELMQTCKAVLNPVVRILQLFLNKIDDKEAKKVICENWLSASL